MFPSVSGRDGECRQGLCRPGKGSPNQPPGRCDLDLRLHSPPAWVYTLVLSLAGWVTMTKVLTQSVPQFPYLESRGDNRWCEGERSSRIGRTQSRAWCDGRALEESPGLTSSDTQIGGPNPCLSVSALVSTESQT